jgi:hypothetical protein
MPDTTARPSYEPPPAPDPAPSARRIGPIARLWLLFTSPGAVFADIRRAPSWALCLAALVAVGVAAQVAIVPHLDTEATLRVRLGDRAASLSEAQIEDLVEQGERIARFGPLIGLVVSPVVLATLAAVYFLMLKLVGSDLDYLGSLSTTLHAYWPATLVGSVLTAAVIQRAGRIPQDELANVVKSHLGVFLPPDAPAWLDSVAGSISVFNLWTVVLLVIGFTVAGAVSRTKATLAVLGPWVLWLVVKAGFGALMGR